MGYFSGKLEKGLSFAASLLRSERKYHTLILLGDDGKIKHIRILRGMIITLLLVQIIVLCSGAYFFSSGMRFVKEMRAMENALVVSQKNYLTIRDEKDILMARLVLAESLINKQTGSVGISKPAEQSENISVNRIPGGVASSNTVLIEKINVSHEANRLKIEFDLKSRLNSEEVSGYSFVILKENETDEAGWLPVPSVSLVSKRPAAVNKGRYFSTSKHSTIKLMTNIRSVPIRFKLATVLVYSVAGELLFEKDFPVSLRSIKEI